MIELKNYRRNPDVAWRLIEGQAVLIHNRLGEILVLNEVGTFIWERIDLGEEALLGNICQEYDVGSEDAKGDLVEFVNALRDCGALVDKDASHDDPS